MTLTLSIECSNKYLSELVLQNCPVSVVRLGIGSETYVAYEVMKNRIVRRHETLDNNAGIYANDMNEVIEYAHIYDDAIKNSNALACFPTSIHEEQDFFLDKYKLPALHNRSLEPFYAIEDGLIPWTHNLIDKKVLIISPFVKSFQRQLDNNFRMFQDKDIFLPNQRFVFYRSYNTSSGNHLHTNWKETFELMKEDIQELDFEIALLSCGGYGLPLTDYIKTELKKQAIYIGGGLQLLFGVMGKRWEERDDWKEWIKNSPSTFIYPSLEERPSNFERVESGCYF